MASYNRTRWYHNQYAQALNHFKGLERETADDMCAELVTDFKCPRLVQVQAWQLRSLCTQNYWWAKSMLKKAMAMFDNLEEEDDGVVRKYREHTVVMLTEVEDLWKARWEEAGEDPPTEQNMQHTYSTGEAEMEAEVDTIEAKMEAEVESAALQAHMEGLELGRELINRGGSPETAELPGGAEAPWQRAAAEGEGAPPQEPGSAGPSAMSPPVSPVSNHDTDMEGPGSE